MLKGLKSKPKSNTQEPPEPSSNKEEQESIENTSALKEEIKVPIEKLESRPQQQLKQAKPLKFSHCEFCSTQGQAVISLEDSFQVLLPKSGPLVPGHFLLVPTDHLTNSIDLENDMLTSYLDLKDKIIEFYNHFYNKKAIFVEFVREVSKAEHFFIECFPVSDSQSDRIYLTVTQELTNSDKEWTNNKKLIQVKDYLKGTIPANFSYVYFDFTSRGLAHLIEDPLRFSKQYTNTLLAESLNIDLLLIRKKLTPTTLLLLQKDYESKWSSFFLSKHGK